MKTRRTSISLQSARRICAAGIAAFLAIGAGRAAAQDVWTGALDATWSLNGNWLDNSEPTGADPVAFISPIPGTGAVITLSAGDLADTVRFQENYTLTGGGLTLTSGDLIVDATFTATFVTPVSGTAVTKRNPGTLILAGANDYTGLTTISEGVVRLQAAGTLGTAAGGTTVVAGAALELRGGVTVTGEALTLNGTGVAAAGALRSLTSNNSFNGAITLATAASVVSEEAGSILTIDPAAGNAFSGAFALTFGGVGDINVNKIIATGAGTLTKDGTGTLRITADPSTTGQMTINDGVVELNHSGTTDFNTVINGPGRLRTLLPDIGDTVDMTINAGAAFEFNSAADTMGGLSGSGTVTRTVAGSSILTVNNGAESTTFSGVIENGAGTVGITKASTGTLTLTGANTFTGILLINNSTAGTPGLIVNGPNGSLATATINIGDNNGGSESMTVGAVGDVWSSGPLNRLADTANVTVNGSSVGGFTYAGPAAGSTGNVETIGTLTISSGRNNITLVPGTGSDVQLSAGTLARANNGTVLFRGDNLGGTGAGSTRLVFATAPTLSGGAGADGTTTKSIIPFATGGGSATSAGTDFVAHDLVNGVRLLTPGEYAATIAGTTALRNVSVGAAGEAVAADVAINSLRVTGGGTVSIAAGQHLNVRSGAVLLVGNGTASTGGIAGPGFLDFGSAEGIIHLAQNTTATTATIGARIAGSAGFAYGRNGDAINILDLSGDNTVIGTVRINQGTIRVQNPGALNDNYPVTLIGRATSALQILGNNVTIRDMQATAGTLTLTNGAATAATLTTYLTAARTFSTALTNGSTGALNLAVSGGAFALTLDADSAATGSVEARTGTILLNGTNGTLNDFTTIAIDGGTLRLTNTSVANNTNRLLNTAPIALTGGALDFDNNASALSFSETVGALSIGAGSSFISVDKAATGQTSVLTAASLTRNAGGALVFNSQNNGTAIFDLGTTSQSRLVLTAAPVADDGILGGWAVVQTSATSREFAKYVAAGTISVRALAAADYAAALVTGANPAQNVNITATPAALAGNTQINSLTLQQASATSVDLGAGNTLRIESGGLIANNDFNANFLNGTLTAGTGTDAAGELIVHTVSAVANPLVIDSLIANNGAGIVTLTKAGAGVLDLQGVTNTYTGKTFVSGGVLRIDADANLGTAPGVPSAGHIAFGSTGTNTLETTATFTLNANRSIAVGPGTNIISIAAGTAGLGKVLTYNGAITGVGTAEGSLRFQSNAVATTGVDPGDISANLTALNLGGTFRVDTGTVTVNGASSTIGRGLQVGMDATGTFNYTTAGGVLTIGKGITDVLEIGVNSSNVLSTVGTLNLAGLAQFTANVDTIRIGHASVNQTGRGIVTLATNNDIVAGTSITLGTTAGSGNGAVVNSIVFGSGINNVTTQSFTVGGDKSVSNATVAAGGTVNLNGAGANTMNLLVASYLSTGTAGTTSTFNMTGGTLTASLNNLIVGQKTGGTNGGTSGIFTVTGSGNAITANGVVLGNVTGNATAGSNATNGTLNFGGGTFLVNNDVALASFGTNTGSTPTSSGTLNVTGGTFTIGGNITRTTTDEARSNSFINVAGGRLDLQNQTGGDLTPGTITASQLAFRSGILADIASATLTATTATNSGIAGTVGDALIVRDTSIPFPVTLTGASDGNIHYEAAGGGTGGLIGGALDFGSVAHTVNVENSAGAIDDLTITGAITNVPVLTKLGTGKLLLDTVIGSGTTILNARVGETHLAQSQTLAALNIDDGALVTIGDVPPTPPAPAFDDTALLAPAVAVPEPGVFALLAPGALALLRRCRRS